QRNTVAIDAGRARRFVRRALRAGLRRPRGFRVALACLLLLLRALVGGLGVRAPGRKQQSDRRDSEGPRRHFPCSCAVGCALGGPSSFFRAFLICSTFPCGLSAVGGGRCVNPDEMPSTIAFRTTPRTVGHSWTSGSTSFPLIGMTVATAFRSGTRSENSRSPSSAIQAFNLLPRSSSVGRTSTFF